MERGGPRGAGLQWHRVRGHAGSVHGHAEISVRRRRSTERIHPEDIEERVVRRIPGGSSGNSKKAATKMGSSRKSSGAKGGKAARAGASSRASGNVGAKNSKAGEKRRTRGGGKLRKTVQPRKKRPKKRPQKEQQPPERSSPANSNLRRSRRSSARQPNHTQTTWCTTLR